MSLTRYLVADANGTIVSELSTSDPAVVALNTPEGGNFAPAPDGVAQMTHRYDAATGEFVALPPVEPSLDTLRTTRKAEAEAYRDQRLNAGCATASGTVDSDEASRNLISGSVQMAVIAKSAGAPFSLTWRMADNSYATLDADAMIGMGVAVGEFVAACYAASFAVKDAIEAADAAAIAAVDITAGYP